MNDLDWARVAKRLAENWPHQLQPDSSLRKMREDLQGFPVDQVLAAIETMYRDGREFPPNGGQILGRLADLTFDVPPWHLALRMIRRALHKPADLIVEDDSEKGWHYEDRRLTWLEEQDPIVAGFVRAVGADKLAMQEGGDEARLREKFKEFTARARESLIYGTLAPAGLRKLERVVNGEITEYLPGQKREPRRVAIPGGGVRRIEREGPAPHKIGFGAVARSGRETG